ncbi:GNAT family N-acetyltransferase [Arenibacter sp. GZD96]|uniref:GNAT family N-acetyltransferase n=1 Tax=Aurantibrevibacter litoralis TaxID=3106030 RepID=UPI002AFE2791|nr:GNAT family N-acetyltransferase [Arenibacter sp. GZD-96]MEA1787384.1 GNAT family N-acetyltransferase [Arenibacter sp. GZD-96]
MKYGTVKDKVHKSIWQRLKHLLLPTSTSMVFDLFQEDKIAHFYTGTVQNTLTHNYLATSNAFDPKFDEGHVFLVKDIPSFLQLTIDTTAHGRQHRCIEQYKGYLVDISNSKDLNDYLDSHLSSRNRKNLRAKQRKLEESGTISYTFHFGEIDKSEYDRLFDAFYRLLEKRFHEKKMYNKNLVQWHYYHALAYPLILAKKASLFVIYDGDNPITLTLNFHKGDIVFSAIQTYDIAYSGYNMGDISMVKHLEWCKSLNVALFDLSMGVTDYKLKWCNRTYSFHYQLFYSKSSLLAHIVLYYTLLKLRLKQYLRDKHIIGKRFQYDTFFYKKQVKKLKNYDWKASNCTEVQN